MGRIDSEAITIPAGRVRFIFPAEPRWIAAFVVANRQHAAFVAATGRETPETLEKSGAGGVPRAVASRQALLAR